jgi:hypothetical protein
MTVRKLDSDGDIATSGQQFVYSQEEIAQTIKTRLYLFVGEYFRDMTEGTDWFGKILGKGKGLQTAEATIRRRIAQTDGVLSIAEFNTDFDLPTRTLSVSCGVVTPYGQTTIDIESPI